MKLFRSECFCDLVLPRRSVRGNFPNHPARPYVLSRLLQPSLQFAQPYHKTWNSSNVLGNQSISPYSSRPAQRQASSYSSPASQSSPTFLLRHAGACHTNRPEERAGVPEADIQKWASILQATCGGAISLTSPLAGWFTDRTGTRRLPDIHSVAHGSAKFSGTEGLLCPAGSTSI